MADSKTLEVKLADSDPESLGTLSVRIEATDFCLSIYPKGYGDLSSADDHGCPVSLEFHQGKLRLVVFPDINSEDPTIIDLSGAREGQRRAPWCLE